MYPVGALDAGLPVASKGVLSELELQTARRDGPGGDAWRDGDDVGTRRCPLCLAEGREETTEKARQEKNR